MSQESVPSVRTQSKETLGEHVRKIADRLKDERDLQIKVTSRILGAAAQIAENHDRLIDEVVDMVEEDLKQKNDVPLTNIYTVEILKQKYKKFGDAKSYFKLKASSWIDLVNKLNNSCIHKQINNMPIEVPMANRLNTIENEIKILRADTSQILALLQRLLQYKEY